MKVRCKFPLLILSILLLSGCSTLLQKRPDADVGLREVNNKELSPETSREVLNQMAGNWFYGQGVGETLLNVGTVAAFPPYAAVVVGNTVLSVAGYEKIGVSTVLPKEDKKAWNSFYDGVTSGPGRLNAAVAGKDYRDRDEAAASIRALLQKEDKVVVAKADNLRYFELDEG